MPKRIYLTTANNLTILDYTLDMSSADAWFSNAEDDMEAAELMHDSEKFSQAAFLYQQTAEKALKAVLINKNAGAPRSHDCFILAKKADAPQHVKDAANSLTPYYVRTRYPDSEALTLDKTEIDKVRSDCEEVLEWTRNNF